jgi:hypothetical protein
VDARVLRGQLSHGAKVTRELHRPRDETPRRCENGGRASPRRRRCLALDFAIGWALREYVFTKTAGWYQAAELKGWGGRASRSHIWWICITEVVWDVCGTLAPNRRSRARGLAGSTEQPQAQNAPRRSAIRSASGAIPRQDPCDYRAHRWCRYRAVEPSQTLLRLAVSAVHSEPCPIESRDRLTAGTCVGPRLAPMSTTSRTMRPDQDGLAALGCPPYAAAKPSRQLG